MNLSLKQLTVYLSLLSIGGGSGWLGNRYLYTQNQLKQSTAVPVVRPVAPNQPPRIRENRVIVRHSSNFIAEAAEKVGPAVVRIDATKRLKNSSNTLNNPLLKRFFGDQLPTPKERVRHGTGSGFIISADGQVLTNAHVVNGADVVQVTLKDGRRFEGKVKGIDDVTDIAAVKLDLKEELPSTPIGRSDIIVPGQWAIAIGNPLGLDNTITVGIISATGRSSSQVGIPDKRVRFIQTDAAINPGNSGGPLLNDEGKVIGINTAIRANAQGLGFAIPIETALRIGTQLFDKGKADHPFLGVQMMELSAANVEDMAEQLEVNIVQTQGVLVVRVVEDSPAAVSGIEKGDVLQKIGGIPVNTPTQVQEVVEMSLIGEELEIEVNRSGEVKRLKVKPTPFPESALATEN
ncbi:MAG: HhoA/HhoB/HtrA family serine endopeptidase [Microcoleaceae cyanobacterium]